MISNLIYDGCGSGANLTIVNQCSETIWAVIGSASGNAEDEVPANTSLTLEKPDGWNGRVWGKTGCIFNDSGSGSCATGDSSAAVTLAEFQLVQSTDDYYDVSLVNGFNLPLVVTPIGGSGSCGSAGCTEDVNRRCPAELRTANGAACRGPCAVFRTAKYCCNGTAACGPSDYSRLFKEVCPRAYSYPMDDDATSLFSCGAAADYSITFCPPLGSLPGDNNAKKIIAVVVSVIIGGAIIVSIIVCCSLKRRHSQNSLKRKCNREVESLLLQHGSLAPKRYRYSEIKKITKSLSDKLGWGGYGSVYKGVLPDGRLVAVKILIEMDSDGEELIHQ